MGKLITDGAGYYFNDDRPSGGKKEEDDLLGCGHCPISMKKDKWRFHGGMCFVCNKTLCFECYGKITKTGCTGPDTEKLLKAVNEHYRKQQNAKILGI